MELVNSMYAYKEKVPSGKRNIAVIKEAIENLVVILAPFIPHATEELWSLMGKECSVHDSKWPNYDPNAIVKDEIEIVIQINGKVREKIMVPVGLSAADTEKEAMKVEKVQKLIEGKNVVKIIAVPGKLVNIVVK